jgi:hypothetical protein
MAHTPPGAAVADDLALIRRRLDQLVSARLQPGWDADDEQVYRLLIERECELLDRLSRRCLSTPARAVSAYRPRR